LVDARASMRISTWQIANNGALTSGKLAEEARV
jgi:hypothetical protein